MEIQKAKELRDKLQEDILKEAAEEFRDYLCDRGFNAIMERVKLHS